jgi:hypothetical protein
MLLSSITWPVRAFLLAAVPVSLAATVVFRFLGAHDHTRPAEDTSETPPNVIDPRSLL